MNKKYHNIVYHITEIKNNPKDDPSFSKFNLTRDEYKRLLISGYLEKELDDCIHCINLEVKTGDIQNKMTVEQKNIIDKLIKYYDEKEDREESIICNIDDKNKRRKKIIDNFIWDLLRNSFYVESFEVDGEVIFKEEDNAIVGDCGSYILRHIDDIYYAEHNFKISYYYYENGNTVSITISRHIGQWDESKDEIK